MGELAMCSDIENYHETSLVPPSNAVFIHWKSYFFKVFPLFRLNVSYSYVSTISIAEIENSPSPPFYEQFLRVQ